MCSYPYGLYLCVLFSRGFIVLSDIYTCDLPGIFFFIRSSACISIYFFLFLSSIPLYTCAAIYPLEFSPVWGCYEWHCHKYICTNLFIAMFSFLLGKYIIIELVVPTVGVSLIFIRNCQFSKVVIAFNIATNNVWEFQLFHNFVSIWCCQSF